MQKKHLTQQSKVGPKILLPLDANGAGPATTL